MSEEESQWPSSECRELSESMAPSKEFYLESLIIDAFKGKGFQKINELLQETDAWPLQKCSKLQMNQLDKLVNKEMDKNEFGNVTLLLKCIQHVCKNDLEEDSALIQQGLVPKMVLWFERSTEFLSVKGLASNASLMSLIEDFFDTALVICKCNANEGRKQLLDSFLVRLGLLVIQKDAAFSLRLEALRTLNSMLDCVPREDRKWLHLSEELCSLTQDLAKTILEAGDYDIQVAISEALCRMITRKWRENLVDRWFADNYLAEAFKEIKDKDFETDCRKFLNDLNSRLGDKRNVYTFPCVTVFADMDEVAKPTDDKLEEFWIDFNIGSHSVTFYINNEEGPLWDSVRLGKELVSNYNLQESNNHKIFSIYLVKPLSIHNQEITKIKIHFDAQFDILPVVKRVLGEEIMQTKADGKEHANISTVHENSTVMTRESTYAQWKNTQRSDLADSPSDILSSQLSDQSSALKMSLDTTSAEKSVISESQIVQTGSNQKPSTILPSASQELESKISAPVILDEVNEIPAEEILDVQDKQEYSSEDNKQEKRNKISPNKQTEAKKKKESFDFQNSPDSLIHETVLEAKHKILTPKVSAHRDKESSRKKRISSVPETKQSVGYWKHLFSDTSGETDSNSLSERSWILEYQKRSLSKSVDYSRKRPRMRSKLKVLPLSSESSLEENKKENAVTISKSVSAIPQKGAKSKTKKLSVPGQELPGTSAFLTPGDSYIKNTAEEHLVDDVETADSVHELGVASSPEYSEVLEMSQKNLHIRSGQNSTQDNVSGAKRQNSDLSAGGVLKKMKLPRRESDKATPEIRLKPRKLFNSTETKNKRQTEVSFAREMNSIELDNVFYDGNQEEEPSDSSVIAVFERFSQNLKKTFWSRYKKMELYAQNALKTSEQHISTLLSQIHQCRLQKLDNFHKIVVEELKSLEEEAQELIDLEKETADFWNKQSAKLNSFCDLQNQRLKIMCSHMEKTVNTFEDAVQQLAKNEKVMEHMEKNFEAT